jgi:hypothetical protein
MKKLGIILLCMLAMYNQPAMSKENCDPSKDTACPNFEFWNKLEDKSVYYSLGWYDLSGNLRDNPMKHIFIELKPNEWRKGLIEKNQQKQNIFCYKIGTPPTGGEQSAINEKEVKAGDKLVCYKFTPGKTLYIRVKGKKGDIEFGPQTGPYLGLTGKTERGYPKAQNVEKKNIQLASFTYVRPEIPTPAGPGPMPQPEMPRYEQPRPEMPKPQPVGLAEPGDVREDEWEAFPPAAKQVYQSTKKPKDEGEGWQHLALGVLAGTPKAQVRKAWLNKSREWHSDKHPEWNTQQKAYADRVLARINIAHDTYKE